MISFASNKISGGIFTPICRAVLRLITSSNFGGSIGRTAGFAPFRILSTYTAARENIAARFTNARKHKDVGSFVESVAVTARFSPVEAHLDGHAETLGLVPARRKIGTISNHIQPYLRQILEVRQCPHCVAYALAAHDSSHEQ